MATTLRWGGALAIAWSLGTVGLVGQARAAEPCVATLVDEPVNNCDGIDQDCDGLTDENYEDGVFCTLSTCVNGLKSNIPNHTLCNDSEPCTRDWCDPASGGCVHLADNSATPDAAVEDGNLCTDLRCVGGKSVNVNVADGTPMPRSPTCFGTGCGNDGLTCTTQWCTGGVLQTEIAADTCLVDGECIDAGAASKTDKCGICQPALSQSETNDLIWIDDFDGAFTWTVENLQTDWWQVSNIVWTPTTNRAYSGSTSMYFGLPVEHHYEEPTYTYQAWHKGRLRTFTAYPSPDTTATSDWLKVPAGVPTELSFWLWLDTEEWVWDLGVDNLLVEVRTSIDPAWSVVWDATSQIAGTTDGQWRKIGVSLADYAGREIKIRYHFFTGDGFSNHFEGAYVDDVRIGTVCCNVAADCDDGLPCSVDYCAQNACRHTWTCGAECQKNRPNLLLVFDRSGSMKGAAGWDPTLSKWEAAVTAITDALGIFGAAVKTGVKLFKSNGGTDSCYVDPLELNADFGSTRTQVQSVLFATGPDGYTPMGAGLAGAGEIYKQRTDLINGKYVLLITDGSETCGGDPVSEIKQLYDDGIETFVVGFGAGVDPEVLSEAAWAGGHAKDIGVAFYSALNPSDLENALADIFAAATAEQCNGADDDCDGETDEDLGALSCSVTCNGTVLAGERLCIEGDWSACLFEPATEVCNNIDDNCNGVIDDNWVDGTGLKLGDPCTLGVGGCARTGVYICNPAGVGEPVCSVTAGPPALAETCNNVDDDCNTFVDENLTRGCSSACGSGYETCAAGVWGGCTAPLVCDTQCDNIDNDSDGVTDPGYPDRGTPCDGADSDLCLNGTWTCTADEAGLECVNEDPAGLVETCGGGDEDCDGAVDEEGAAGCTVYFYDGDADTFGVTDPPARCLCAPLAEWTATVAGDCLDTNAAVNPAATEVCNGLDDECDGHVDEDPTNDAVVMTKVCYNGPAGTLGVGTCHAGLDTCNGASGWSGCLGEVVPTAGEYCDGEDTDCDSVPDNLEPGPGQPATDDPCALDVQCEFGTCYCLENKNTLVWSCVME